MVTDASMLPILHAVSQFFAAADWEPGTRPLSCLPMSK
jgi:hypothetical protein